ncbi:MAG TPA: glycosyltransferase family 4 protein [Thermoplasmata archaeon]|nr:glycosyltransferase family 4 protein [Thermoplasmata archaeon]
MSIAGPTPRSSRPPRLVLLTGLDLRAYRGGEKYAANLARQLAARGIQVLLYSKVDRFERLRLTDAELPATVGVPFAFYRLFWLPRLPPLPLEPRRFLATLRGADTIFSLESTPRFVVLIVVLGRLLGRRTVVGLHDPTQVDRLAREVAEPGPGRWRARLFCLALRHAAAVHTINAAQAATLRRAGVPDNVAMVHSFTTAEPVPRAARSSGGFELLFVGPLEREQKGIDLLVEVGRQLLRARADLRLTIVGAGRDIGLVEGLVREGAGRVRYRGFVPETELAGIYAEADALLLPSRAESFSLVALEAFTQGVPVVSFDLPGLADVMSVYPEGRAPAFDPAACTTRVLALYDLRAREPAAYERLRAQCRERAIERFGARVQVPKLAEMLGLPLP